MSQFELKEDPNELYDALTAMIMAGENTLSMRSILLKIKTYWDKKEPYLGRYVNEILLEENETKAGDLDSIRHLLHEEIDETVSKTDLREKLKLKYCE